MKTINGLSLKKNSFINILQRDLFLLYLGLGVGYVILWGVSIYQRMYQQADFIGFYTAGAIIRDGRGSSLYDFNLQTQYQSNILPGLQFEHGPLVYINPPYAALPFAILALLPYKTAYIVWGIIQIVLLAWLLKLLSAISSSYQNVERRLMIGAVLAFPLLLVDLVQGAFSLFILLCLAQLYLALKSDREYRMGAWTVGGMVKPQNMLLIGVFLIGSRRWKAVFSGVLGGLVLFLLCGWFFGWEIWPSYLKTLSLYNSAYNQFGVSPAAMYNLRGSLTLLLNGASPALISQISWIVLLFTVPAVFLIWWGRGTKNNRSTELRLSLTILLGLFFSPHFNPHDGLLLVLPALLFYIYLREHGLPHTAFSIFCLSAPFLVLISEYVIGDLLGIRIVVIMMLIFAAWMIMALYKEYQSTCNLEMVDEAV